MVTLVAHSGEAKNLSVRDCSTAWLGMLLTCCRRTSISDTLDGRNRNADALLRGLTKIKLA
jgi:hypothetical protein